MQRLESCQAHGEGYRMSAALQGLGGEDLGAKDETGDLRRNPDLNQEGFQKARSVVLGKVFAQVPCGPGGGVAGEAVPHPSSVGAGIVLRHL